MRCPCPKCDAVNELVEQDISPGVNSQRCSECNEKYWTLREEYTLRAYKKQGRIYCFDCGHELGCEILCTNCGSICPDYCVVQSSKPVARKQQKAGFSFSFARHPKTVSSIDTFRDIPERQREAVSTSRPKMNRLAYVALAALVLLLAGGLFKVYEDNKVNQLYAKNFIVALYGIKSGTDLSLENMNALSFEWKKALEIAGVAPRPSQKDLDRVKVVKTKVAEAMDKLSESPEKFANAKTSLVRLYGLYVEISALNASPPGSLNDLTAAINKLEAAFFKEAGALRDSMPKELQEELQASLGKYRNLGFMAKGA